MYMFKYNQPLILGFMMSEQNSTCSRCKLNFNNEFELEIHNLKVHKNCTVLCLLCDDEVKGITHHLNRKHKDDYKKAKEEKNVKSLYKTGDNMKCKFCDHTAAALQFLITHIKNIHIAAQTKCELCGKIMQQSALYDHMRNLHSDPSSKYKWNCDICNLNFKTDATYRKHLKCDEHIIAEKNKNLDTVKIEEKLKTLNVVMGTKKYKCKHCKEILDDRDSWIEHLKLKHNAKTFSCYECKKEFTDEARLHRHENTHEDNKHECSTCFKLFSRKDQLTRHINEVHNKKEYVKCDFCGQDIIKRNYVERHAKLCAVNQALRKYQGKSNWERIVFKFFTINDIEFMYQKKFEDLKNKQYLPYDFYVPSIRTLVEINGLQHYVPMSYRNGKEKFEEVQQVDKLKKEYAEKNKYGLLVIDTREYNNEEKIFKLLEGVFL